MSTWYSPLPLSITQASVTSPLNSSSSMPAISRAFPDALQDESRAAKQSWPVGRTLESAALVQRVEHEGVTQNRRRCAVARAAALAQSRDTCIHNTARPHLWREPSMRVHVIVASTLSPPLVRRLRYLVKVLQQYSEGRVRRTGPCTRRWPR